jgi:hypothetical protein
MSRGAKPGERRGGRTKGTPNKRTAALEEATQRTAQVLAEELGEDAFPGDAHSLLMAVYKDKRNPVDLRVEAAKAACPYEKPRLNTVDHGIKKGSGARFTMTIEGGDGK